MTKLSAYHGVHMHHSRLPMLHPEAWWHSHLVAKIAEISHSIA